VLASCRAVMVNRGWIVGMCVLVLLLQGLLEAHESVAGHTLADLPACSTSTAAAELPTLLLIDTAGCNFDEQQEEDGDSR